VFLRLGRYAARLTPRRRERIALQVASGQRPKAVSENNRRARGEGLGWEFVHVAIDDASRIAFAKVMANEKKRSATAFLKAALA
jgi:hypothetical protein